MVLQRIVDLVETYAHCVHHGKEEEILFRALHAKGLEPAHRRTTEELARERVEMSSLVEALSKPLGSTGRETGKARLVSGGVGWAGGDLSRPPGR